MLTPDQPPNANRTVGLSYETSVTQAFGHVGASHGRLGRAPVKYYSVVIAYIRMIHALETVHRWRQITYNVRSGAVLVRSFNNPLFEPAHTTQSTPANNMLASVRYIHFWSTGVSNGRQRIRTRPEITRNVPYPIAPRASTQRAYRTSAAAQCARDRCKLNKAKTRQ